MATQSQINLGKYLRGLFGTATPDELADASGGGGGEPTDPQIAYIRSNGNDSTGVIGGLPFATGNAAYAAALASGAGVDNTLFDFGSGTFTMSDISDSVINYRGEGIGLTKLHFSGVNGVDGTGANGASLTFVDCGNQSALVLTATGGNGGSSPSGNGGGGGGLTLKNCYTLSAICGDGAASDVAYGGNGGSLTSANSYGAYLAAGNGYADGSGGSIYLLRDNTVNTLVLGTGGGGTANGTLQDYSINVNLCSGNPRVDADGNPSSNNIGDF